MCGIAGEVSFRHEVLMPALAGVSAGIGHRGPDDEGLWQSPDGHCGLAHRRLSIMDLSPAGHQPMLDPLTGNAIVFNGEIYNFQSLRRDCEAAGDRFSSQTDTEVILALYRRYGAGCLRRLRGMFAFAIWDASRQELFLARDRVGKKPLNYALTTNGLLICSEIDPLSRHPRIEQDMDLDALELYLQLQYIPAPSTIYRQIRKLPPAHYAIFNRDGLRLEKYWDVDYRTKVRIAEAEALEGLEEKLTEAVRLRMIADVPLGALLSGGVDSSVVVALMAKINSAPVKTFSIGFEEEAFSEIAYANEAAGICRTQHHPQIVKGNVEGLLPKLIRHYGEPYADSSAVPSFFVCATAREHVTVALNGDGGDELLGGYGRYWLKPASLWSARLLGNFLSPEWLVRTTPWFSAVRSIPGRAARRLMSEYIHPELRSVLMYSGFWNDEDRAQLLGGGGGSASLLQQWRTSWLRGGFDHAGNPVDRMLWMDNRTYLPGDLLVKMDIASMHCGLETRSPLLDHEVIEYCAALPESLKVNRGIGKYLLKRLAEKYFPAPFVHRRKMGFGIPLADWLRGPLHPLLDDVLADAEVMAPLDAAVIRNSRTEFAANVGGHESRLWTLLMYGLWKRHAFDR